MSWVMGKHVVPFDGFVQVHAHLHLPLLERLDQGARSVELESRLVHGGIQDFEVRRTVDEFDRNIQGDDRILAPGEPEPDAGHDQEGKSGGEGEFDSFASLLLHGDLFRQVQVPAQKE